MSGKWYEGGSENKVGQPFLGLYKFAGYLEETFRTLKLSALSSQTKRGRLKQNFLGELETANAEQLANQIYTRNLRSMGQCLVQKNSVCPLIDHFESQTTPPYLV